MSSILELWDPAPSDAKIAGDEVHILSANLQQPATPTDLMWDTLSSDEQRRAERFRFERDRARFIKGRSLLREILGWYLATEPAQLRFTYSSKGKPALAEPWAASRIDFNVAHSEGIALYALACGREVGVDVERVQRLPDMWEVAERFFSPGEIAALRAVPAHRREEAFFACWTRKEAFLKATGDGLGRALDSFEVSLAPEHEPRLLRVEGDPLGPERWSLRKLSPGLGYVGALVAEGRNLEFSCWRWTEGRTAPKSAW